jgi:hypothetical protein
VSLHPRDPTVEDHEDDSYGACVICREYRPHTDEEFNLVRFPCAVVRLAALATRIDAYDFAQCGWEEEHRAALLR